MFVRHFKVRTGCEIDWEIRNEVKYRLVTTAVDAYGRTATETSCSGTNENGKLDRMGMVTRVASSLYKSALP